MKKLFFLFTFVSCLLSAQNRFIYEYKFVSDSTKRDDVFKEMMYLDISKDMSKYYSRDLFVSDSLMRIEIEKQINNRSSNVLPVNRYRGKIGYQVFKEYKNNKTFLETKIAGDNYKVLEDRNIDWKILPEKQKIGEFESQKATAEFAGRKWTAWFTEDVPFSDGPYKFRGLPGLIVKIEDATQSHVMELKASTKFTPINEEKKDNVNAGGERRIVIMGGGFSMGKETLEISRQQYKKLFWEDRDDPMKSLRMMQGREGVTINFKDQSGNNISFADAIKNREEAAKEAAKRNNNLLELDLLKK